MTSLHHDRRVDDGQEAALAAPAATPAPDRGTSRLPAGPVGTTGDQRVPTQRLGKASRRGTDPAVADAPAGTSGPGHPAAKGSAVRAVAAATSFAARARAAATTRAARAAAARTAPVGRDTATSVTARTAVAPAAAGEVVDRVRPTPFPRPRPAADGRQAVPSADVVVPEAGPASVDEALAHLQRDPAEVVPALDGGARYRVPALRRRPALYLAAGLVASLSLGALLDTDPSARADATTVTEAVSVAEQLGIDGEPEAAISDAESTRLLQELVVSRNQRDAESTAAADAQAAADVQAVMAAAAAFEAAAEAARPKAVAPVNGARLTSGFGPRWGSMHTGIDLAAPMRTPEYAVMDGIVLEAGPASGYGLVVSIQHDNGDVTVYGHMDEILVEPGELVRAGDTIALLGNRGQSTGPHLHFEVHKGGLDGTKVDPIPWLRERGVHI